ncbi:MAG: sulfotransferase family protein [Thainema sp.]
MPKVIGAGLGRTGTNSLKLALERLLGEPCYHMIEVFGHPEHVPLWHAAALGETVDWSVIFDGYAATVDWPSASFWPELSDAYPDALIIWSYRTPASWWKSASSTIFPKLQETEGQWYEMMYTLLDKRFTLNLNDRDACIAAFHRHNEQVLDADLGNRLLKWQASDGWEPICQALGVDIPNEPFPHVNSTADFLKRT